ncbi:galectin-7 [Dendropsophus ebraccatus]|uniref:galectin-7 n=1 Tax=Dendropsophus ebraccatus TaxID=150705 RepID=UPI003831E408
MPYFPAIDYQADYNPPVPYTTKIPGGLRVGMVVCVQAKLPSNYNRWAINFATGQEESSDVAFHLNARYDGPECVVFNSKEDEVWGEEEMKEDVPFKSGKVFVVMFEITENIYQVFVNGAPFYEFGHRIPLESVQWLQVVGDITIQELSILGNGQDVKDKVSKGRETTCEPQRGHLNDYRLIGEEQRKKGEKK